MEAAPRLTDAHVHIDSAPDVATLLQDAGQHDLGMLVMTCEPAEYERLLPYFQPQGTGKAAMLALGLHPWWAAREDTDENVLERFERLAPSAVSFGELGLDFHDHHTSPDSHPRQLETFECACLAAAASSKQAGTRKPLSLHSLKAVDETLAILERAGCLETCACIFHWFTGSVPQLERAREAGCWFSFNERQLRTGKGREYVKLIPPDKLLLETDLPAHGKDVVTVQSIEASLQAALSIIAQATDSGNARTRIQANASALLGLR